MSAGVRVPILEAAPIAWSLQELLIHSCERIEIAGSIRRGQSDVGDIELLAIPKTHEEPLLNVGMFDTDEGTITVNDLVVAVEQMRTAGILTETEQHRANGERYVKAVHAGSGLQVDIFMVRPPATWGCLYLIRTGPQRYSQWVVTEARRRGFHFVDGALHKGTLGCGAIPCEVVPTPEETDVYAALGLPWVRPEDRS